MLEQAATPCCLHAKNAHWVEECARAVSLATHHLLVHPQMRISYKAQWPSIGVPAPMCLEAGCEHCLWHIAKQRYLLVLKCLSIIRHDAACAWTCWQLDVMLTSALGCRMQSWHYLLGICPPPGTRRSCLTISL